LYSSEFANELAELKGMSVLPKVTSKATHTENEIKNYMNPNLQTNRSNMSICYADWPLVVKHMRNCYFYYDPGVHSGGPDIMYRSNNHLIAFQIKNGLQKLNQRMMVEELEKSSYQYHPLQFTFVFVCLNIDPEVMNLSGVSVKDGNGNKLAICFKAGSSFSYTTIASGITFTVRNNMDVVVLLEAGLNLLITKPNVDYLLRLAQQRDTHHSLELVHRLIN